MFGFLTSLFSGGAAKGLENVASEWIETNQEKAEAQAVMVKAIDPNGKMRRDLSQFASRAYGFYLVATTVLIFLHAYGVGDAVASGESMDAMKELFMPITTAWAGIVGASFGVNGVNSYKGRP